MTMRSKKMGKVVVLDHPLIDHKMAKIRDKNTNTKEFRETVSEIGMLITYEISRDFETVEKKLKHQFNGQTPMN